MAKITKIKIKNLFGISEFEADEKSLELLGGNGTGKTSILDAIRYALTNRSTRDCIVKKGETEGEIIIETDSGLTITRKPRTNKTDYKSIKLNDKEIQSPEAFLSEIFTELQLNPVAFLNMDNKEQNRIILDLIQYHWTLETIRGWFGEIPQGVNYEKHILEVLQQIASEDGQYFLHRQNINRDIRNKKAFIEDIVKDLPEAFNAEKWEAYDLQEIHTRIEQARQHNSKIEKAAALKANYDNKVRGFQAEKEMKIAEMNRQIQDEKTALEAAHARLLAELKANEKALFSLNGKQIDKEKVVKAEYEAAVSKFHEELKTFEPYLQQQKINIQPLQEEAAEALKMKQQLPQYNKMLAMQSEIDELKAKSDEFTRKIELARTLPATILAEANLPLADMTIEEGQVLIKKENGFLPVSNLSEGEKLDLCVDIALKSKANLQIVLIDGVEKLSAANQKRLYEKCMASGLQFIATKTTNDNELTVVELTGFVEENREEKDTALTV